MADQSARDAICGALYGAGYQAPPFNGADPVSAALRALGIPANAKADEVAAAFALWRIVVDHNYAVGLVRDERGYVLGTIGPKLPGDGPRRGETPAAAVLRLAEALDA